MLDNIYNTLVIQACTHTHTHSLSHNLHYPFLLLNLLFIHSYIHTFSLHERRIKPFKSLLLFRTVPSQILGVEVGGMFTHFNLITPNENKSV